jgi:hypothetical protein
MSRPSPSPRTPQATPKSLSVAINHRSEPRGRSRGHTGRRMRSFAINLNGRRYQAAWTPPDGGIEVLSDYGRWSAELNGREPGQIAREVLERQLSARLARD